MSPSEDSRFLTGNDVLDYTEKQGRPESQHWLIYRAFMTMNKFKHWRVKILEYRYEISNTMLNVSRSFSNSFRIVMCLFYV